MDTSASATDVTRNDTHTLQRGGFVAFALITAAYIIVLARFTMFPFQDFPNHLTRATVLADLLFHHGAKFGPMFEFRFMPVPYILGDLMLASLVEIFGPTAAGALWNTVVLLSWPAALLFLTHVSGVSRNARLLVLFLSLYLATDWFFLMAFIHFRLGMALLVVALGVAHLLRLRFTTARFAWFCVLLLAGYSTHLAFVIFLAPALIVSAAVRLYFRRTTVRTELALIAPVLGVMLWHFGFADRAYWSEDPGLYRWRFKLFGLQAEFLRFGTRFAKVLMLLFAVVLGWGLWRDLQWRTLLKPQVVEMLALAVTFLCIYVVLPSRSNHVAYVDVRALALISLFIVLARVHLAEGATQPAFGGPVVLPLAAILAMLNLGYLAIHHTRDDAWMSSYREVVARIPRNAAVLPVYTSGQEGAVAPRLYSSSYIVMDRVALMPYLFSGDAGHAQMKYFRYKSRPYAPTEHWYNFNVPEAVDWHTVACSYDFLLVGKPYDPKRIFVRNSTVAENGSAALLKVDAGGTENGCVRNGDVLGWLRSISFAIAVTTQDG